VSIENSIFNHHKTPPGSLFVLEFDDKLLAVIKQAIRKHAIRGADSVHLASAIWLRSMRRARNGSWRSVPSKPATFFR